MLIAVAYLLFGLMIAECAVYVWGRNDTELTRHDPAILWLVGVLLWPIALFVSVFQMVRDRNAGNIRN